MSGFTSEGFYTNPGPGGSGYWGESIEQSGYSSTYDMSGTDFGQDQHFQNFDYSQNQASGYRQQEAPVAYENNPYLSSSYETPYTGDLLMPDSAPSSSPASGAYVPDGNEFDDEPPLLEELGINPDHIIQKTLTVLNPFRETDSNILQDTDLAGPLVFCLAFGGFLLLSGKVHFNYIYGIGVFGCLGMYILLNLMSLSGVSFGVTVSILGYCILPMVALAGISIIVSLQGIFGMVLTSLAILWCSFSASRLFVTALTMDHHQPLVAYPCALLYGVFALITTF